MWNGGLVKWVWFPHNILICVWYYWNIVKSGVQHHNPNSNVQVVIPMSYMCVI